MLHGTAKTISISYIYKNLQTSFCDFQGFHCMPNMYRYWLVIKTHSKKSAHYLEAVHQTKIPDIALIKVRNTVRSQLMGKKNNTIMPKPY